MSHCKNCGNEVPEESLYCPKCGKPVETAAGLKLAYWGERFVGWLIDIVILGAIMLPLRFFASVAWPGYAFVPSFPVSIPFFDSATLSTFCIGRSWKDHTVDQPER